MCATYRKIHQWSDVPPAGPLNADVRESHGLDFKENASPEKTAEHAKDMATFANTFGGVILLGTKVDQGIVSHPGISRAHAARMAEVYEQAAKDLCSPSPIVNAIIIAMPGSSDVLLAVNVDPMIEGPVGSRSGKEQDAWLFPMREGSHTKFLKPNELPMHMNPKLRRTLLMLDCIKDREKVRLWHQPEAMTGGGASAALDLPAQEASKHGVDLAKNSVTFIVESPNAFVGVPLTEVDEVWKDHKGLWNLRLGGRIKFTPDGLWHFQPVVR